MPENRIGPSGAGDTVPIRPLRKWVSRLVVTVAILASGALGIYAAMTMRTLADDPAVRRRIERLERMRRAGVPAGADSTGADSSNAAIPLDSTVAAPGQPDSP